MGREQTSRLSDSLLQQFYQDLIFNKQQIFRKLQVIFSFPKYLLSFYIFDNWLNKKSSITDRFNALISLRAFLLQFPQQIDLCQSPFHHW